MAYYNPGAEPENLKKRIRTLFDKLDSAYPDKNIVGLHNEHKKWGETVTKLYKELGYSDGKSFLEAYGYKYGTKDLNGGRPKTTDPEAIIKELQKRYPNGSPYETAEKLFEANPDYFPKLKTMTNVSKATFGMPFGKYLLSIGLIQSKRASKENKTEKTVKEKSDKQPKKMPDKKTNKDENISDGLMDLSEGIILSADGKTVIGFKKRRTKAKVMICIPSGVEKIEDNVFLNVKIDRLYLPKELKYLGKYTINNMYLSGSDETLPKRVGFIEVEEGNENFVSDGNGLYSIVGGKKKLIRLFNENLTTYVAPDDVIFFESNCFSTCVALKNIILPDGVVTFDESALVYNTQVEEIFLPKTVKHIYTRTLFGIDTQRNRVAYRVDEESNYLFRDEDSIYEVLEDGTYKLVLCFYTGKGEIQILDGTSVIGAEAFKRHKNITQIEFPQTLRVIEREAFAETGLESLVIHKHIQRIESRAFFNCGDLKSVKLSSDLEHIAKDTFQACRKLQKIDSEGEKNIIFYENNIINKLADSSRLEVETNVFFDEFLKNRSQDCFDVNMSTGLNEDLVENDNLINAFQFFEINSCDEGNIVSFEISIFDEFENVTLEIPKKLEEKDIQILDLENIPNCIEKLIIPASIKLLKSIESSVLFSRSGASLASVEISLDNEAYSSDGKAIFTKDKKTLLRFMSYKSTEYVIPDGTKEIAQRAFCGAENLTKLVLPQTIRKINSFAFENCTKLEDIRGLEFVSEVGKKIFEGDSLYNGQVPFEEKASIIIIGTTLFKCNISDESVVKVPDGITKIHSSAFETRSDNDQVEEIILPPSVQSIGERAFYGRKKLKKINIPEGVKELCEGVFGGCSKLEEIFIPASIEKINILAFPKYRAGGQFYEETQCILRKIEVDINNRNYCSVDGMLFSKDKKELLCVPNGIPNDRLEVPVGVKLANDYMASRNIALTEVVLPNTLTTIGKEAFSYCGNLTKIVFSEEVENIGEYAFVGCSNLIEIVLPQKLKCIGKYAFSECNNLTKIVFPEELECIGESAFLRCSNLKEIIWPKRLERIEDWSFKCTGLQNVLLPETLLHIGESAFGETEIQKVTIPKSVQTIGMAAFSCVPEIEVYDCIEPNAPDAKEDINAINKDVNSMVGYVGNGPRWEQRCDYAITVKSAKTDEIKYKVWMGADDSQSDYYSFLESAWGHNATFDFSGLDEFFPKIRGKDIKLQVAKYRLAYPCELTEKAKTRYENYIKENS